MKLLLFILLSISGLNSWADSGTYGGLDITYGTLTVYKNFSIVRTYERNPHSGATNEARELSLAPGRYKDFGLWYSHYKYEKPTLTFLQSHGKSVETTAFSSRKTGSRAVFPAEGTGQSFTLIDDTDVQISRGAQYRETQECSVTAYCSDSFYGCTQAMGTKDVVAYDVTTTVAHRVQFLGRSKETLAVYVGSEGPEVVKINASESKCHLNINQ